MIYAVLARDASPPWIGRADSLESGLTLFGNGIGLPD